MQIILFVSLYKFCPASLKEPHQLEGSVIDQNYSKAQKPVPLHIVLQESTGGALNNQRLRQLFAQKSVDNQKR